ncbi:hypothetical protein [Maricaulis maris]|uniref:hypothetical protein n=1 Tax=Maricaulis maris TaxID=74318 RepID=UPI003B8E8678
MDAEDVAEFDIVSEFDCRWVRTAGQFRAIDYWHYRGQIKPSGLAVYDRSETAIWIENFAEPTPSFGNLHQRDIELVGLFYDLCLRAEAGRAAAEADGEILINMGGPCHYGRLNGLMLDDVRVVAVNSTRPERLRGESNRDSFGDLVDLHAIAPDAVVEVRDTANAMLSNLAAGERAYLEHALADPDFVADRLADSNDATSMMAAWAETALAAADNNPSELAYRAFAQRERGWYADPYYDEPQPVYEAIACFCTAQDCADEWPLLEPDTWFIADTVMCLGVEGPDDGWPVE